MLDRRSFLVALSASAANVSVDVRGRTGDVAALVTRKPGLRVDDLLAREGVLEARYRRPPVISPIGDAAAFVRLRSRLGRRRLERTFSSLGNDGSDIWLFSNGKVRNLTRGDRDDSSWTRPVWSPSGQALAMLSTRDGGDGLSLWIWHRQSDSLVRLTGHDVGALALNGSMAWISDDEVLAGRLIDTRARESSEDALRELTARGHHQFVSGELAVTVATTAPVAFRDNVQFTVINVRNQHVRTLDGLERIEMHPLASYSSSGGFLCVEQILGSFDRPDSSRIVDQASPSWPRSLLVMDLKGAVRFNSKQSGYELAKFVDWSPKGDRLLCRLFKGAKPVGLLEVDCVRGEPRPIRLDGLRPDHTSEPIWMSNGKLIIAAWSTSRRDYYYVSTTSQPRNLTADISSPQSRLALSEDKLLVLSERGSVYVIEPEGGAVRELNVEGVSQLVAAPKTAQGEITHAIFQRGKSENAEFYRLETSSFEVFPIKKPAPDSEPISFLSDDKNISSVWAADRTSGATLWFTRLGHATVEVAPHHRTVPSLGRVVRLEYRSKAEEALTGWLVLPPDYRSGRQYPLVVAVYPGWIYDDPPPGASSPQYSIIPGFAPQLLAAQGFVVLHPSMPTQARLGPDGTSMSIEDPYARLSEGVIPAIEQTISLGYADSDRISIIGHSAGGYASLGLAAQDSRFKAVISAAGVSDLTSLHSAMSVARPVDWTFMFNTESGQFSLGNPSWRDVDRFTRNSPLRWVEGIQAATLLIHGEADARVPVQQSEQMFRGLYRAGKTAKFLRYWGEGHELLNPSNVRNMWSEIFSWLDRYCDIQRDGTGNLVWDRAKVARRGNSFLPPESYIRLERFFSSEAD